MLSHIYEILKKRVQINLLRKCKQSHRCSKQNYSYHRGKGGGINWETDPGFDTYTVHGVTKSRTQLSD